MSTGADFAGWCRAGFRDVEIVPLTGAACAGIAGHARERVTEGVRHRPVLMQLTS